MAGSIAEAMMAARAVDQKQVQGGTNAIRRMSLQANQGDDEIRDMPAYRQYQREMQDAGRKPVSYKQWQMMYRHQR